MTLIALTTVTNLAHREFLYRPVERIPEDLEPGVLYHVPQYSIASHLCACGCGFEVVTALQARRWRLSVSQGKPTLTPSIGNGSLPCKSHYFIINGRVRWAGVYTTQMIERARRRDNPRRYRSRPQVPDLRERPDYAPQVSAKENFRVTLWQRIIRWFTGAI